jgi:hypothetical protein
MGMSGGSYNYAYVHVNDMANSLRINRGPSRAKRLAFKKHLELVSEAMRAIEWVDSGDSSDGDEIAAIDAVLERGAPLKAMIDSARETLNELSEAIADASREVPK